MNPGITEEAGLTARTLVESFKSAPAMLAILVFNIMFIAVIAYLSHASQTRWEKDSARWRELVEIALKICPSPSTVP